MHTVGDELTPPPQVGIAQQLQFTRRVGVGAFLSARQGLAEVAPNHGVLDDSYARLSPVDVGVTRTIVRCGLPISAEWEVGVVLDPTGTAVSIKASPPLAFAHYKPSFSTPAYQLNVLAPMAGAPVQGTAQIPTVCSVRYNCVSYIVEREMSAPSLMDEQTPDVDLVLSAFSDSAGCDASEPTRVVFSGVLVGADFDMAIECMRKQQVERPGTQVSSAFSPAIPFAPLQTTVSCEDTSSAAYTRLVQLCVQHQNDIVCDTTTGKLAIIGLDPAKEGLYRSIEECVVACDLRSEKRTWECRAVVMRRGRRVVTLFILTSLAPCAGIWVLRHEEVLSEGGSVCSTLSSTLTGRDVGDYSYYENGSCQVTRGLWSGATQGGFIDSFAGCLRPASSKFGPFLDALMHGDAPCVQWEGLVEACKASCTRTRLLAGQHALLRDAHFFKHQVSLYAQRNKTECRMLFGREYDAPFPKMLQGVAVPAAQWGMLYISVFSHEGYDEAKVATDFEGDGDYLEEIQCVRDYVDASPSTGALPAVVVCNVHADMRNVVHLYKNCGFRGDEHDGARKFVLLADYGDGIAVQQEREYVVGPGPCGIAIGKMGHAGRVIDPDVQVQLVVGESDNSWTLRDITDPLHAQDVVVIIFRCKPSVPW